ncbi:hypothetical protein B0H19DRAFT_1109889 [Mycena capillaripes]|nr:hypothetical protein B0H19DRAFT_1109889 [Mycena capillaripes]
MLLPFRFFFCLLYLLFFPHTDLDLTGSPPTSPLVPAAGLFFSFSFLPIAFSSQTASSPSLLPPFPLHPLFSSSHARI